MTVSHILGYPRIGAQRELKKATEAYWKGDLDRDALEQTAKTLRADHWQAQQGAGLDLVSVGDFAFYDIHTPDCGLKTPRVRQFSRQYAGP